MTKDRMPEIREADAPPEVAEIYREIREATGLPLVNLAWRHMAALPGVLPWIWDIVGPAYRSGEVAQVASGLRAPASDLALVPLRDDEMERAGLDQPARQLLADLLEAYNRGNTQNLIGWSALLVYLCGQGDARQEAPRVDTIARTPLSPLPPLPPLPRREDLDQMSAAVVERLSARHKSFPAGAVPSLYLHLTVWPGLLEPIDARLRQAFEAGRFAGAASKLAAIIHDAHRI
jgi:hypothetical protein